MNSSWTSSNASSSLSYNELFSSMEYKLFFLRYISFLWKLPLFLCSFSSYYLPIFHMDILKNNDTFYHTSKNLMVVYLYVFQIIFSSFSQVEFFFYLIQGWSDHDPYVLLIYLNSLRIIHLFLTSLLSLSSHMKWVFTYFIDLQVLDIFYFFNSQNLWIKSKWKRSQDFLNNCWSFNNVHNFIYSKEEIWNVFFIHLWTFKLYTMSLNFIPLYLTISFISLSQTFFTKSLCITLTKITYHGH